MKLNFKIMLYLLSIMIFVVSIYGCESAKTENESYLKDNYDISLNYGAVNISEDGKYNIENYVDGKYDNIAEDKVIIDYDMDTKSFLSSEKGFLYINRNEKKFKTSDENYIDAKISPKAKYFSYFIDDTGYKLRVFKTDKNEEVKIESDITISGTIYDWFDDHTLIYYGVKNDGTNGLFTYDIDSKEEKMFYEIKDGFLAYLKSYDEHIVYLQVNMENKKTLVKINKDTEESNIITEKIEHITDMIESNGKIYFTGKIEDNSDSLYVIENNKVKRLIFDFPVKTETSKGLSKDSEGNILFVGMKDTNDTKVQIFSYEKDGTISVISKKSSDFEFIKIE
ncbi:DUF5050 domain-containing protein [Clostridium sp. BJN0001]|uniref:DUF5050 domain-containing protein n=1 Tax=Clostridium sp. BJN0001 TaxID=2930219 RepID=UPI001FD36B23|nr:DUF5050 domain-containing protein [Clostridium sp. BJN0001]